MRKLMYFIAIFAFLLIGCKKTDITGSTKDEIELRGAFDLFAQSLMKKTTDLSLEDYRHKSEQFNSFLNELATEIMELDNEDSIIFCLYFENEKMVLELLENDITEVDLRSFDCEGGKDCEKCISAKCLTKFIEEKMDEYKACAEFRIEKKLSDTIVYGRPCKKN